MTTITPQRRLDRGIPLGGVESAAASEKWLLPLLQAESESAGAVILAKELQSTGPLRCVAIGIFDETQRLKLAAVSGIPDFDPRSPLGLKLQYALTEAARETENGTKNSSSSTASAAAKSAVEQTGATTSSNAAPSTISTAAALHQAAQALTAAAAVRVPFVMQQSGTLACWGMALLFGDPVPLQSIVRHPQAPLAFARIAAAGFLLKAGRRSLSERSWSEFRAFASSRWLRALAAAFLTAGILLALPMPYRIGGRCVVEPTARRIIAAPFAATLGRVHVQPGDVVAEGALLAELDGSELRLQLASWVAKLEQAQIKYETSLAKGIAFEVKQAELEIEQLQAEIELNERHLQQLEIRSPLAGTVLSGQLRRLQGTPVTLGQNLLEIAPANEMLMEVEIPAAEIAYIQPGARVELRLDALPGESRTAVLERLPPRSELRQDRHVFVAEVPLAETTQQIRPGMAGSAVIVTPSRPLGWNLFHHAWETVALWIGW